MSERIEHMNCELIELPQLKNENGNLTFIEEIEHYSFSVERAYWLYDIPAGESRDGHAYKELKEIIIALSGSFKVAVSDHNGKEMIYEMNRSSQALYVPSLTWRQIRSFSTNSVVFILASLPYSEEDYIYDFDEFIQRRNCE